MSRTMEAQEQPTFFGHDAHRLVATLHDHRNVTNNGEDLRWCTAFTCVGLRGTGKNPGRDTPAPGARPNTMHVLMCCYSIMARSCRSAKTYQSVTTVYTTSTKLANTGRPPRDKHAQGCIFKTRFANKGSSIFLLKARTHTCKKSP